MLPSRILGRGLRVSLASVCAVVSACACATLAVPGAAAAATAPTLLWSDEFTGPAGRAPDPNHWQAVTGDWGGGDGELEYYTGSPANASLDGAGHLAITARRQSVWAAGRQYPFTSARLQTLGMFATTYGQLRARIKLPPGRGLWPAFWSLGTDIYDVGWPDSGEIDVMESLGSEPFTAYGSLHGPEPGLPDGFGVSASKISPTSLTGGFHVYNVTWRPGKITFTLDGVSYGSFTPTTLDGGTWVFDKPFFLLLNLAVGGDWPGAPSSTTVFPATMLVDWVRVYS
jgi:beta-glucanase (GH16 family)